MIVLKSGSRSSSEPGSHDSIRDAVTQIITAVRERGDDAVREYSEKFDGWSPSTFQLTSDEIEHIVSQVPDEVLHDIRSVQERVRKFARLQLESLHEFEAETEPGVFLGQRHIPVSRVGAYVPGGRYPLVASAHMTIVTAKVAGVKDVVAATPPISGKPPVATVAAMHLAGADQIFILGGVQAVAAMAIGTATIPKADIIAGPGNAFVAEAKRQLFGDVGIDLLAGPTEVLIIADEHADPFVTAVDLLSQAEHGPDSPAILVTTSRALATEVIEHVERLLPDLPTRDYAGPAWRDYGQVILVQDLDEAYEVADRFAAEHVQVFTREPREALTKLRNYGALFLGEETCVSYGDKVIGTNHTLPTRKAATYTGGLWVGKYLKTVTYQEIRNRDSSVALGKLLGRMARLESFEGHARSGDIRVAKYGGRTIPWAPDVSYS